MLVAGQVVATDRAVGHQLAALAAIPPPTPPAQVAVLLPQGLLQLAVASAAFLRQWKALTLLETRPLLLIRPPARLPPAWLPLLIPGLRRRTCMRMSACEPT